MDDLVSYCALQVARAILFFLEGLLEPLLGWTLTRGWKSERLRALSDYSASAQVVRVLWKTRMYMFKETKERCFLYRHDKYVHPDYVLKRRNVSLMGVDKDYAVFLETDPSVDIYDSKKFPFLVVSQLDEVKERVIIMPIESFHRLADDLGDPQFPVGLMSMTNRCGSTLVVQMLNQVPGIRVLSENRALSTIDELMGERVITPDENDRLLRSTLRTLCKVSPGEQVDRVFLKLSRRNARQFVVIAQLFPKFHLIVNTRHPVPSLESIGRTTGKATSGSLWDRLGINWRENIRKKWLFPYDGKYDYILERLNLNPWWPSISFEEQNILMHCLVVASYFDHRDLYDRAILYENLVRDPEGEMRGLFDCMEIPHEHLESSLEAMKRDSQNGFFGARRQGGRRQEKGFSPGTPEFQTALARHLGYFGLRIDPGSEEGFCDLFVKSKGARNGRQ